MQLSMWKSTYLCRINKSGHLLLFILLGHLITFIHSTLLSCIQHCTHNSFVNCWFHSDFVSFVIFSFISLFFLSTSTIPWVFESILPCVCIPSFILSHCLFLSHCLLFCIFLPISYQYHVLLASLPSLLPSSLPFLLSSLIPFLKTLSIMS